MKRQYTMFGWDGNETTTITYDELVDLIHAQLSPNELWTMDLAVNQSFCYQTAHGFETIIRTK